MLVPLLSLYCSTCSKLSSILMTRIRAWCKTGGMVTAARDCVANGIFAILDALIWRLTTSMISIRQSSHCSLDRHFLILLATPCRLRSISSSLLFNKLVMTSFVKLCSLDFFVSLGGGFTFASSSCMDGFTSSVTPTPSLSPPPCSGSSCAAFLLFIVVL